MQESPRIHHYCHSLIEDKQHIGFSIPTPPIAFVTSLLHGDLTKELTPYE